jgi:predicted transcriptional regulator
MRAPAAHRKLPEPVAKRKVKKAPPPLHELEGRVMDEVWRQGEATVRDVLTALNRGRKQRAYTTVMTIMARLDVKGLLTRKRRGKTDVYRPVMSRAEYADARAQAEVEGLVAEFGDVALAHFAERVDRLDAKRLRELRKLARRD